MHWQDIAISIAQWVSIVALFPSVWSNDKPALTSSLLTAACIVVYAVAYLTLGLTVSTVSATLLLVMWLVLAYQKWRMRG
jgi:hypothetical protein